MDIKTQLKALNNVTRLKILEWLKDPDSHFPPHYESGLSFEVGVCVAFIQDKAGISQSTTSQYMTILHQAGFVVSTRIGKWTYYRRDEEKIAQFMEELGGVITLGEKDNDS